MSTVTCGDSGIPRGAGFSYRNGIRTYPGARQLWKIHVQSRASASAAFTTRREIELVYDDDALQCLVSPRGPLRLIREIRQRVWRADGTEEVLPTITFGYGSSGRTPVPTGQRLPPPLRTPLIGPASP